MKNVTLEFIKGFLKATQTSLVCNGMEQAKTLMIHAPGGNANRIKKIIEEEFSGDEQIDLIEVYEEVWQGELEES